MDLKDKIEKSLEKKEIVKDAFALEVYKRKYEAQPVWEILHDKTEIVRYDVFDENGVKLFSLPTTKKLTEYQIQNEIVKHLNASLKQKIDASTISYDYSPAQKSFSDMKSVKYQVVKHNSEYIARIKRQLVNRFDSENAARNFIDNYKSLLRDKFSSVKMSSNFDIRNDTEGKFKVHLTQDILKSFLTEDEAYAFIDDYKQIIREAQSMKKTSFNVKSVDYSTFVKEWFKSHPGAKPGEATTVKQLKEDWDSTQKKSSLVAYKIYQFGDRTAFLLATKVLQQKGYNFSSDENNNSVEVELLDKEESDEVDEFLSQSNLKYESSDTFLGEELMEINEQLETNVEIKCEASYKKDKFENDIESLESKGAAFVFTKVYKFADDKSFYKACKALHQNLIMYQADEENQSLGIFSESVDSLFEKANIDFVSVDDLMQEQHEQEKAQRQAKRMMDSEFDVSQGCWRLENMPDGSMTFVKTKPLLDKINDVLSKRKSSYEGIKIVAKRIFCDIGQDQSIEVRILSVNPDNDTKIIVEDVKTSKTFTVNKNDVYPIE